MILGEKDAKHAEKQRRIFRDYAGRGVERPLKKV
jgi:hypothetical protein